jgi:hypothetical protein
MGSRALLVLGQESHFCTTNSQPHYRWNYEDFYNEHYPNFSDHGGQNEKVPALLLEFTSHQPASSKLFYGHLTLLPPPPPQQQQQQQQQQQHWPHTSTE